MVLNESNLQSDYYNSMFDVFNFKETGMSIHQSGNIFFSLSVITLEDKFKNYQQCVAGGLEQDSLIVTDMSGLKSGNGKLIII